MYQFTEDCLTGISAIDEEHRHLFDLINEINELLPLDKKSVPTSFLKSILEELQRYANKHFAHEEQYMEEIADPEIVRQKKEHAQFKEKMNGFHVDQYGAEVETEEVKKLVEYIVRWLYHHILGSDIMIGKIQKTIDNDPFAFTDQYRTGIVQIDEEHHRLFDIIRQTNDLIHADNLYDKYDEIVEIIQGLKEYTVMHFQDEEEYMERIKYEGIEQQKRSHEAFVNELNEINLDEVDDNQQKTLEYIVDYLLDWLSNHILKEDKLIPAICEIN